MRETHAAAVSRLHAAALTGVLADLGEHAARAYYRGGLASGEALGFVDEDGGAVKGFVWGSRRPAGLRAAAAKAAPVATVAGVLFGLLRRPSLVLALLSRGPEEGRYDATVPELTYLAVDPAARRSGTGAALVEAFVRAVGGPVELSVDEDNPEAAAFYERTGFKPVGRYREFGRAHARLRRER